MTKWLSLAVAFICPALIICLHSSYVRNIADAQHTQEMLGTLVGLLCLALGAATILCLVVFFFELMRKEELGEAL